GDHRRPMPRRRRRTRRVPLRYRGTAPRGLSRPTAPSPVRGEGDGSRGAGESTAMVKVTDGRVEAATLKRAFVSTMLVAARTTKTTRPASAWTNGRFNASLPSRVVA